jgi:hypothetical protein
MGENKVQVWSCHEQNTTHHTTYIIKYKLMYNSIKIVLRLFKVRNIIL